MKISLLIEGRPKITFESNWQPKMYDSVEVQNVGSGEESEAMRVTDIAYVVGKQDTETAVSIYAHVTLEPDDVSIEKA